MIKILFNLLTSPLGLPISFIWEYLILAGIGAIAYAVGWAVSEGGEFGCLVHWSVRLVVFIVLWAVTYGVIALVRWICTNWVLVLCILGGILLIASIAVISILLIKKKKKAGGDKI